MKPKNLYVSVKIVFARGKYILYLLVHVGLKNRNPTRSGIMTFKLKGKSEVSGNGIHRKLAFLL